MCVYDNVIIHVSVCVSSCVHTFCILVALF